MPELPEAETVANALAAVLPGRRIEKVEVFTPSMREPLTPLLSAGLAGRRIEAVKRRGRYVIVVLDDGRSLLLHFGMTGVVRVEPASVSRRKHEHLFLHLDDGMVFRFECVRRFSICKVVRGEGEAELAKLGPEPLTEAFDGAYLYRLSRGRGCPVKSFLMDNGVVAGIGNIYAAETLFAAGVRPSRRTGSLKRKECDRLAREAKRILQWAIEEGGSSISDFRHVDGSEGKFARELKVYGRTGEACPVCGATIAAERIGGRGSFYCPECQK